MTAANPAASRQAVVEARHWCRWSHGDHAANYLNRGMQWSGGTVGTVTGRANVAALFASVVAAFPDAHITIDDIFGQADQIVVRVVVSQNHV